MIADREVESIKLHDWMGIKNAGREVSIINIRNRKLFIVFD